MKALFPGYYKKSEEQIQQAWKDCLFVFDANVLLNLYRYPEAAKQELLKVLGELIDRIWVPYQAVLEFQRNRLQVISEQIGRFNDVRKVVQKSQSNIRGEIDRLQLGKRHSVINPEQFLNDIDSVYNEFLTELSSLESSQLDVTDDDEVREALDRILDGRIGKPPESQDWLEEVYKDGEIRYKRGRPPGLQDVDKSKQDENKPSEFFHNGLRYERKYGDLILWKQLLEKASSVGSKTLIFVTDDLKEDWWWIEWSRGKKTIGPRPELVEEIQNSGIDIFLMYNSERFLRFASEYLGIEVQEKSIQQVRDIVEQSSSVLPTITIFDSDLRISLAAIDELDLLDFEYLDLLEIFEEGFAKGKKILESIAKTVQNVGERMKLHTNEINQLKAGKKPVAAKDAKRVMNAAARDIFDFADELEERTAGFSELFEESISMLSLAATRIEVNERETQIKEVIPHIENLSRQIQDSLTAHEGMRDAIANLPRLTAEFNKAKRRGVDATALLIESLYKIQRMTEETITFLEEQIPGSQS